ncbi:histidine kinase [Enterovibrio coralii]|uniref:histidine kinase n=2 Tax=Enterovibrio coralii TaxID=294935 RepID=A0A135I829_9GAMM|nr:sensor histidine kinase [Enterovibrio coralii]KXF81577.1 histidine kinase [Enterovibrio coralii]
MRLTPLVAIKAAFFSIITLCCICVCPVQAEPMQHYDVGVLALRGNEHAKKAWQPTLDWLAQEIPGVYFDLHTYDFDELDDAFKHNQLDFLLTSPGQATRIAREYQLNWLATQRTPYSANTTHSIASVVVVHKDSPYFYLRDIKHANIAAVSAKAFGGFLAFRYELDKRRYFNADFYENIKFTGPPTDKLLHDVVSRDLDVAIVPACTLENMTKEGLINRTDVRVLERRNPYDSVCDVSTGVYPNWTFAKTERASNEIGKKVTQALLAMPSDAEAAIAAGNVGWTMPASPVSVDKVFKHLDIHPLQKSRQEMLYQWLESNKLVAFACVFVVLMMSIYHVWVEYHFNRSKRQLERTMFELKERNSMLEHAQRTMIVSELGSSIAHEINQPLSTIKNYSEGVIRRLDQGMSPDELAPVLGKIQHQVTVASGIIQRLRGLIKQTPTDYVTCDPAEFVRESIALIEYDFKAKNIHLELSIDGVPQQGQFDIIGMQQVMLNLLRNAKDACLENTARDKAPTVNVEMLYGLNEIVIRVQDNGIGLAASEAEVKRPFYTTKDDGLGLGLPICREVIEAHKGHLIMQALKPHGCEVTVVIPIKREEVE